MSRTTYRRRSLLLSVAMAAGAAAAIAIPAPAQAAVGQLTLAQRPGGPIVRVVDPPAGCHAVRSGFNFVDNRLNTYVTVYPGTFCSGFGTVVPAGSAASLGATAFSVQVPI